MQKMFGKSEKLCLEYISFLQNSVAFTIPYVIV